MRFAAFAARNRKELLRDPLTLLFGVGLPLIMLWLFSVMQENMPYQLYKIESLAPGVAVFSFSFVTLFSGMLIARDRSSSYLIRLFASPLHAFDYIIGYTLPLFPLALLQSVMCFAAAFFLGLSFTVNIIAAVAVLLVIALLYISIGLLFGTLFNDKQVGGSFAIFVNLAAWLSGTWFDLNMIGGLFKTIGYALPFSHAADAARAAIAGDYQTLLPHLLWCTCYSAAIYLLVIFLFKRKMRG